MKMSENKEKIVFVLIIFLIAISIFYRKIKNDDTNIEKIERNQVESVEKESLEKEEVVEDILIHLSGQVKNPGIVQLKTGDRLIDAVEIVGGLLEDADLSGVNLAQKLVDEEKIHIPKLGEESENSKVVGSDRDINKSLDEKGKINISTCDKSQLLSLPGVGEKTAEKILEYRDMNGFKDIEDLKNVSGIGDKKFDAIKEFIIVK